MAIAFGSSPHQPRCQETSRIAWAKLRARVGEEFPLQCPSCGGDIRLIAFIAEPGPIRKILKALGQPLEPPPLAPARGPPTDWGELVQVHDDRDVFQATDSRTAPDRYPLAVRPTRRARNCPTAEIVGGEGETPTLPRGCRGRGTPRKNRSAAAQRGPHAAHRPSTGCGRTVDRRILSTTENQSV